MMDMIVEVKLSGILAVSFGGSIVIKTCNTERLFNYENCEGNLTFTSELLRLIVESAQLLSLSF